MTPPPAPAAHTAAPWTIASDLGPLVTAANGVNVCEVLNPIVASKAQKPVPQDLEEIRANARLIASAPALLAVAEMVAALDDQWGSQGPLVEAARTAIRAARGEG